MVNIDNDPMEAALRYAQPNCTRLRRGGYAYCLGYHSRRFTVIAKRNRKIFIISKDDYDKWRYNYPKYDMSGHLVKVPSKELSDALIEGLKKKKD